MLVIHNSVRCTLNHQVKTWSSTASGLASPGLTSDRLVCHKCLTLHTGKYLDIIVLLFNKSKSHGSGCTTSISRMHRYLYCVYCLTPSTSLCNDNRQNLHKSTVERVPKQCPHPRPMVNVVATHPNC